MAAPSILSATLPFLSEESSLSYAASHFLSQGGGELLSIDATSGFNAFHLPAGPANEPSYASSFASPISTGAFASVQRLLAQFEAPFEISARDYGAELEKIRLRLRECYNLPHTVDVIFATSPSSLEYVALALGLREAPAGVCNIVLGHEELDSGSDLAAAGLHHEAKTPTGLSVQKGEAIDPGLQDCVRVVPISLRDPAGDPIPSDDIVLSIASAIEEAQRAQQLPIVRLVHGTKTGLVAPVIAHLDAMRRRFGHAMVLTVDATQGRISRDFIAAYLARGATVLLSGSRFIGGPPESAFALVPASARKSLATLPPGYSAYFSSHEWPTTWPGSGDLPDFANLGLLTRLCAAVFELELYSALAPGELRRVVHQFNGASKRLMRDLGFGAVAFEHSKSTSEEQLRPLELQTLVVMDTSRRRLTEDHLAARGLHLQLINAKIRGSKPVRLGPPVKCLKLPDGRYAGNLTVSLSMPQIVEFAALESSALSERLDQEFQAIAKRVRELT